MKRVLLACRLFTGAVFLFAAVTKLPDLRAFAETIANFRILPAAVVGPIAAMVVGVELLTGLALTAGVFTRPAATLASGMLVLFIGFLVQALARGIDLRCGCFGGDELATWGTVVRDVALLVPALLVALQPRPAPQTVS